MLTYTRIPKASAPVSVQLLQTDTGFRNVDVSRLYLSHILVVLLGHVLDDRVIHDQSRLVVLEHG